MVPGNLHRVEDAYSAPGRIPLLGLCPRENLPTMLKKPCSQMFITTMFIIATTCERPKRPSMGMQGYVTAEICEFNLHVQIPYYNGKRKEKASENLNVV